jgi:hypothetical protein
MSEANIPSGADVSATSNIEQSSGASEVIAHAQTGEPTQQPAQDEAVKNAIEQEVRDMKRKFKLKVDGQEIEEEIDLSDEESIKKHLQLSKVAQKRMQESAMLQKDVETFIQQMQKDPINAISQLGVNFDSLAEQYVNQKLEELEKSPEQLEREKQIKELEELKAEREELRQKAEQAEQKRLQEKYVAEIDNDIDAALSDSNFQLPKSPYVVKRMAETMMLAMEKGYHNVKAKDILPVVEKQFHSDFQEMFGRLPEEVIEQMMGKNTVDRLRKYRVSKARKAKTQTARQIAKETGQSSKGKEPQSQEKIPMKDFFKNLGKN